MSLFAANCADGRDPSHRHRSVAFTPTVCRDAPREKWGWVERSVARQASPPSVRSQEPDTPVAADVQKVVAKADKNDPVMAALLATGALTGARRGELCALRLSDLDSDVPVLTIRRSVFEMSRGGWGEKDTKTHQVGRVDLDEVALHVLELHGERVEIRAKRAGLNLRPDGFVFPRPRPDWNLYGPTSSRSSHSEWLAGWASR
jgi:integrase